MPNPLFSTGEAARLCSVKPDTVLKWIKKGILPATRTLGGHFRVHEEDLIRILSQKSGEGIPTEETKLCSRPMRCWEYMNNGPGTECHDCVVYKTHASWCFRMASLVKGAGHGKRFCAGVCPECPYYRRVHGLPANVLLISQDEDLIQELATSRNEAVTFRFARRGNDASAIIAVFRPAVVVFDQAILEDVGMALLDALANDPKIRGARMVVAIRKGSLGLRVYNRVVYATIEEPFDADEIAALINQIPVESVEPETADARA
jgi:excisionase family DNA binding protein